MVVALKLLMMAIAGGTSCHPFAEGLKLLGSRSPISVTSIPACLAIF
jgi:hypothetical protein